jgi:hypothetical protein
MANALVKKARGGKLSPAPPKGPPQDEAANVKKAKPAGHAMDEERGYRAADALRTLTEARKISQDKQLMKDVHAHAAETVKSLSELLSGTVTKGRGK